MSPVVYDAGVLVAADRNVRAVWAEHRVRLEAGIVPVVPAPVVAQVSRSPEQVQLRRLLRGCQVTTLTEQGAHAAGHLLGRSGTRDVVDAVVAHTAAQLDADIVTGDSADIGRLLDAAGATSRIISLNAVCGLLNGPAAGSVPLWPRTQARTRCPTARQCRSRSRQRYPASAPPR